MTDFAKLKELAEATGGVSWEWWTSNSILRLTTECEGRHGPDGDAISAYQSNVECPVKYRDFIAAANPAVVLGLIAENEALRRDAESRIEWAKEASAEIDRLQGIEVECGTLRDDLEQIQYDANAWRNGEESVWIEVFNSEGDDPFISAITGQITVEQLALIQAEILEYREDYFEKGSGLYVFRCAHYQAHYDNVGMTEPAHWETDFESYSPFPREEDAAAMSKEPSNG